MIFLLITIMIMITVKYIFFWKPIKFIDFFGKELSYFFLENLSSLTADIREPLINKQTDEVSQLQIPNV